MIALVLGGAPVVWDDLARAEALIGSSGRFVIACNHVGFLYTGHLDGWATLHSDLMDGWRERRAAAGLNTDVLTFTPDTHPQRWHGSSGLYAAQIALDAGATGVILCGVPMDPEAGHVTGAASWPHVDRYRAGFTEAKADGANIRSMSGWTADLFGEPTGDWLRAQGVEPTAERPMKAETAMHVRFTEAFDYTPTGEPRTTIAFPAGFEGTVKRECGLKAVRDKKAVEIKTPKAPKA